MDKLKIGVTDKEMQDYTVMNCMSYCFAPVFIFLCDIACSNKGPEIYDITKSKESITF